MNALITKYSITLINTNILICMKLKNVSQLFIIAFVLICIASSCVKEGPMGLTGTGLNGKDGTNGTDANTACLKCHATSVMDAKESEYHLSKHFTGTSSARNGKYCARCHTSEGFIEITDNGKFVVSNDIANATRINCATCHKHSGFDFVGDTAVYTLRTTTPVVLEYFKNDPTKANDFGKINNLCATCHQIRGATSVSYTDATVTPNVVKTFSQLPFFPLDNTKETTTVKFQVGQSFAVHDGNQSNLFAGINAYEYVGKTYTKTWKHSTFSCTDCHMNAYDATTKTGGHSLIPNTAKCTACHGGTDKLTPIQTSIDAKIIELAEALTAKKIFKKTTNSNGVASYSAVPSHDFYGVLFPTTASTTTYATALAGANTVSPTTGLVTYANNVTIAVDKDFASRIGREWKYGELGAAYNYGYINSELSRGIHNPTYALQVLQNSIDYLKAY
jgi:hypothetical protein